MHHGGHIRAKCLDQRIFLGCRVEQGFVAYRRQNRTDTCGRIRAQPHQNQRHSGGMLVKGLAGKGAFTSQRLAHPLHSLLHLCSPGIVKTIGYGLEPGRIKRTFEGKLGRFRHDG